MDLISIPSSVCRWSVSLLPHRSQNSNHVVPSIRWLVGLMIVQNVHLFGIIYSVFDSVFEASSSSDDPLDVESIARPDSAAKMLLILANSYGDLSMRLPLFTMSSALANSSRYFDISRLFLKLHC